MNANVILYFVKYPTPGKVKTRLAKSVGHEEAARLYRELAETNYKIVRAAKNTDLIVLFDMPQKEGIIKQWLMGADSYVVQQGDDLGERLKNAFLRAFQNSYQKVSVLGSDILGLTTDIVEQGFLELNNADAVIGPAKDGGYYLIGLSSYQPRIFDGIAWSTSGVLQQTYQAINDAGLSLQTLCPLEDLDEIKQGEKYEPIGH